MDTTALLAQVAKYKEPHTNGNNARYGYVTAKKTLKGKDNVIDVGSICHGQMLNWFIHGTLSDVEAIFSVFPGSSDPNGEIYPTNFIGGIHSPLAHGYETNERTLRWLRFIMDPELSLWKPLLPRLTFQKPEEVNEHLLLLIEKPQGIPFSLMYNFFIASRWCREHPTKFNLWLHLQDAHGLDPRKAFVIAVNFGYYSQDPAKSREYPKDLIFRDISSGGHEPLGFFAEGVRKIVYGEPSWDQYKNLIGEVHCHPWTPNSRKIPAMHWNAFKTLEDLDIELPKHDRTTELTAWEKRNYGPNYGPRPARSLNQLLEFIETFNPAKEGVVQQVVKRLTGRSKKPVTSLSSYVPVQVEMAFDDLLDASEQF